MCYTEYIQQLPLIRDDEIEVVLTTGDPDYPGTAIEVTTGDIELFHVVLGEDGTQQVMFLPHVSGYRLQLSTLEAMVSSAKEKVVSVPYESK